MAVLPALIPDPHETARIMVNTLEGEIEIREQGYLGGVEPPWSLWPLEAQHRWSALLFSVPA